MNAGKSMAIFGAIVMVGILVFSLSTGYLPAANGLRVYRSERPFTYWATLAILAFFGFGAVPIILR